MGFFSQNEGFSSQMFDRFLDTPLLWMSQISRKINDFENKDADKDSHTSNKKHSKIGTFKGQMRQSIQEWTK